jgi:WS/DGAT/MGAT family acyltransferase
MRAARWLAGLLKGLPTLAPLGRPVSQYSLVGPVGPHRRWTWTEASLADVKRIRTALGGTVNDVVLAAITNGYRELLAAHGDDLDDTVVRSLVPVSTRRADEHGAYNNRVSAMFAELPVGVADPADRLERIREQLGHLKASGQAVAAETLTSMAGFGPPMLLSVGIRAATVTLRRMPHSSVTTVTTNVPGPQRPLYAVGRRMLAAYPYVPIMNPVRVGVAIFSYDGKLTFGVTGDFDTIPDLHVLCRGIDAGIAELLARAQGARRSRRPARTGVSGRSNLRGAER